MMEKGHIKTAEDYKKMKLKLKAVTTDNIKKKNNRSKLLSKKYQKKVEA